MTEEEVEETVEEAAGGQVHKVATPQPSKAKRKTSSGEGIRCQDWLVELGGLEPPNLLAASQALYQLSYSPVR